MKGLTTRPMKNLAEGLTKQQTKQQTLQQTKRFCALTLMVSLFLLTASTAALAVDQQSSRGSIYFLYNGWNTDFGELGDGDLKQSIFGLHAVLVPRDRFRLQIDGSLSSNSAKGTGEFLGTSQSFDESFSTLNDTRIKATLYSASQSTSVSAYLGLPTGKTELSLEQYAIVIAMSDASRKYVVRRVGQGLDLGGEGLFHPQLGDATLSIGGAFFYRGPFRARAFDTEDYKYGNEVHGIGGVSYDGRNVDVSGNLTLIYYFKDKFGDQEVYQAGITQLYQASIQYSEMFNLYAGANLLFRGAAKAPEQPGGEEFVEEQLNSGRNEMLLYAGGSYPIVPELSILGQLELKTMSENEYTETSVLFRPGASYVGISGGAGYKFTPMVGISGMLSYYSGSIDGIDSQLGMIPDADLSGFGATFVLTVRAQ